jgi:hypothetical protein
MVSLAMVPFARRKLRLSGIAYRRKATSNPCEPAIREIVDVMHEITGVLVHIETAVRSPRSDMHGSTRSLVAASLSVDDLTLAWTTPAT